MRLACLAEGSQSLPHILGGQLEESLTLQIIDMHFPAFSGLNLVEKSVFLIQENDCSLCSSFNLSGTQHLQAIILNLWKSSQSHTFALKQILHKPIKKLKHTVYMYITKLFSIKTVDLYEKIMFYDINYFLFVYTVQYSNVKPFSQLSSLIPYAWSCIGD